MPLLSCWLPEPVLLVVTVRGGLEPVLIVNDDGIDTLITCPPSPLIVNQPRVGVGELRATTGEVAEKLPLVARMVTVPLPDPGRTIVPKFRAEFWAIDNG